MLISDIFYSIQGEGFHTGKAAIFIRFYGCNRECSFCDEPLHQRVCDEYDFPRLMEKIVHFPAKLIVLTGGEPSLHNRNDLILKLQNLDYYVATETNGYNFNHISNSNWITYSPKELASFNPTAPFHELKLIINDQNNLSEWLKDILPLNQPVFLQPESSLNEVEKKNIQHCVALVKKYPQLQLSLQIHKMIKIL